MPNIFQGYLNKDNLKQVSTIFKMSEFEVLEHLILFVNQNNVTGDKDSTCYDRVLTDLIYCGPMAFACGLSFETTLSYLAKLHSFNYTDCGVKLRRVLDIFGCGTPEIFKA